MTASAILMTTWVIFLGRLAHGVYSPRVLETAEMIIGFLGLLTLVILRHDFSGLDVLGQGFETARECVLPASHGTSKTESEEQS